MIVGFAGRRRSGKDTAAQVLVQAGFERVLFAGPLKNMIRCLLREQGVPDDVTEAMIEGHLKETPSPFLNGRSARHAMQTIGTEWGRELIDENLWVDATMRAARQHRRVVITDCRFPNEVAAIKAAGGTVVRVTRPWTSTDTHPSEALIDTLEVDHELVNDGTIGQLQDKVRDLLDNRF